MAAVRGDDGAEPAVDLGERLVPRRLDELAVALDTRRADAVGIGVELAQRRGRGGGLDAAGNRVAGTPAGVRSRFLALAARLDREPLPWPGGNPAQLDGNGLRQTMLDSLYDPEDYPVLAKQMLAAEAGELPPAPANPPEALLQNYVAVGAATICNDAAWPRSAAVYEKGVAESRAKYPLTAGMPRNAMVCAAWQWQPSEAPPRVTDHGPSNVLMVQNERDVATPLSGALKMREALGRRAVMVTVNSTGHGAYLENGNACGDATVSRFLATGQRPAEDHYCK